MISHSNRNGLMITKKAVSLILVVATLLLAGCSSGSSKDKKSEGSGQSKTIPKIYVYNNSGAMQSGITSNPQKLEAIKKVIIEETGVEPVIIVPPTDANDATQKLNILLSSGEQVDLFWANWQDYASKNMILSINDLLSKNGKDITKNISSDFFIGMTDKDKKVWGIPRFTPTVSYPVWIREDWLKKLNIAMPKTMDELEKALKAIKAADPAGSGSTITMLADLKSLRYCFLGAYMDYGYSNFKDADGKIKPAQLAPGYKDFLTKMNEWYQQGLISKEAFVYKTTQNVEFIKQNKVAATALWYSRVSLNHGALTQNFPDANYQIASVTGARGKAETINPASNTGLLFSAKIKDKEAAMKLMNWYLEDIEHYITGWAGVKGTDWTYKDEKEHVFQLTNPNSKDYAGELNLGLGLFNEARASTYDPINVKHTNYLKNDILKLDRAKKQFDFGITYDQAAIDTAVPNSADITKMEDEQELKFIIGARPLSEFDKYISELNKAGLEKYIAEITRQYTALTK